MASFDPAKYAAAAGRRKRAAAKQSAAAAEIKATMPDLIEQIPLARAAGIPQVQIAADTGLSAEAVRRIEQGLDRTGKKPAEATT